MFAFAMTDLDEYSRIALPRILARFPEWETLAVLVPRDFGAGASVEFNIPCPSPAVESGLWLSTADDELTVGFHTHHCHFTDYETRLNSAQIDAGADHAAALLGDLCGVVSWYEGDRVVGTVSCDLPLCGPLPRLFADLPVSRGTLRSWSGRFDREEPELGDR